MSQGPEGQATLAPPQSVAPGLYEEINPDLTHVDAYAETKQAIARDVRYLRQLLQKRKSERRDARCQTLMAKLAEDHFTLAVLGQFKRGKSSLMNAIIGRPLLPTGVLPLTSAITVLRFGPRERLMIEHEGSTVLNEVPISELPEYVTERGNPGNRKRVSRAVVEIPSPFLRRGLEFVDTPGVGSALEASAAVTRQFLPQCDAVIFITSVDSPISQAEMEFLSEIREYVRKIFFVVNKTDLLNGDECDEVLGYINRNLQNLMNTASVRLFPLSCWNGLKAKAQGDLEAYARSGVKGLEETLSEFLSTEKISAFLVSLLDRAIAVADEELRETEIESRAAEVSADEILREHLALQLRLDEIRASRERDLSALREQLRAFVEEYVRSALPAVVQREEGASRAEVREALGNRRWRTAYGAIRELNRDFALRLNGARDGWATGIADSLWPQLETLVQQELRLVLRQLSGIPQAAAEILNLETTLLLAPDEFEELHMEKDVLTRSLAKELQSRELRWQFTPPRGFGFLPVCWTHNLLTRHCVRAMKEGLRIAATAIHDSVIESSEDVLDKAISRVQERARDVEERVEAIFTRRESGSSCASQCQSFAEDCERLRELRTGMSALRDRIVESRAPQKQGVALLPVPVETERPRESAAAAAPSPRLDDVDIARDLRTRGCPVCKRAQAAVWDFLTHWQYELYGNEGSQDVFAAEGGLCRFHTWQLAALASPQGISRGYPRLVDRVAREIARLASDDDHHAESILSLMPDSRSCRACQVVRATETMYLERLAAFTQGPGGSAGYRRSQGVCLRHLAQLLKLDMPRETKSALLRHTSRILSATMEDMQSFALKHDALRRSLNNQDDDDAYLRALVRLAGARYLAAPWDTDEVDL